MKVKKIKSSDFHLANKLNGRASKAKYGIFKNEIQIGVVVSDRLWDAWDLECKKRLIDFSCGSLKQLKDVLAAK